MTEKKAVKAKKDVIYYFYRTGKVEGASGSHEIPKNKIIEASPTEFAHLFDEDGNSRYCEKK